MREVSTRMPITMKQHFEIYILTDQLLPEYWLNLYKALLSYLTTLSKFEITFRCTDNVVRFFISSDKDLSSLSNNLEGILLRPVDKQELQPPETVTKERFMQFMTGDNILGLKEKIAVKKGKDLQYAVFKIRAINIDKAIVRSNLYFKNAGGQWSKTNKIAPVFPSKLLSIDFATNTHYLKKTVPKYLNIEKSLFMLSSDNVDALFTVDTFPYFSHNYYLNLTSYEFDKHSFIIGASGSGKSKFIGLFVDRLYRTALKMNYRIIVIDPHASLASDFTHIPESKIVNFNSESTQLFGGAAADISAATELTSTLFKSLMGESYSPKADRLLRFSLFVLFTAQTMSLDNLKRFLTDIELRNQIMEHVASYVPANIVQFFGADFNELRTKYYNESISPLVSLVDEMQLQPVLVGEGELSLAKTIQDNFLTVFSLNKVSMGERVVKTVAGLLIQQIFLLAQARAFNEKVVLIIDEVSVVQNPALASILAEARKFNLSVILTQQYFGQIEKDLRDAIFANVYNYYTFKVSEEDARALEGNMNIELPKELVDKEAQKRHKESDIRIKIMTELHPRECLVRVLANGQVVPAIKAKTADAPNAVPTAQANPDTLREYKQAQASLPTKFKEGSGIVQTPSLPAAPTESVPATAPPANTAPMPEQGPLPQNVDEVAPFTGSQLGGSSAGLFNLSDLLAEHSSSRLKVNKRKDQ